MHLIELLIYTITFGAGGMAFSLALVYNIRQKNNPNRLTEFLFIILTVLLGILLLLILQRFSNLGVVLFGETKASSIFGVVLNLVVFLGMGFIMIFLPRFANFLVANPAEKGFKILDGIVSILYFVAGIFNVYYDFKGSLNFFGELQTILFSMIYFYTVILIWINLKSITSLYIRKICLGFNIVSLSMIPLLVFCFIFPILEGLSYALFILAFIILTIIYYLNYFSQESFKEDKKVQLTIDNLSEYKISKREFEVIELIDKGLTNKEIGEKLGISVNTVNNHVSKIFTKVGVRSRIDLLNTLRKK